MRSKSQAQPEFLSTINHNQRVPADHPLRPTKSRVDKILRKLSPLFDQLYSPEGRPAVPPEQLLKEPPAHRPLLRDSLRHHCRKLRAENQAQRTDALVFSDVSLS